MSRNFQPFSDDSRSFRKISEDYRKFPKTAEDVRRFPWRNPKIQYSPGFPEYCCAWVEKRDHSPFEHRLKVHGPNFEEQIRIYNAKRLWLFHEKPSKHLTVFYPETVNNKKMANLTANTKNYRQITLNTKPHSDPPLWLLNRSLVFRFNISGTATGRLLLYSWFSRDVTKILKSKPGGLQNFYLLLRKDYLKIYLFTIPQLDIVHSFENIAVSISNFHRA